MKTNYYATLYLLHVFENYLFGLLGVIVEEDYHYTSPDPQVYEPTIDGDIPEDVLKHTKSQMFDLYKKRAQRLHNYNNYDDLFK